MQNILDVFKSRKAHRDKYRVNNAVKSVIEGGMLPGPPLQQAELGALFHQRHHQKCQQNGICRAARVYQHLQNRLCQPLQYAGNQCRRHAQQEQGHQQSQRLLFHRVLPVDIPQQKRRGQNSSQYVDR